MPLIAMTDVPAAPSAAEDGTVYGPYLLCGWKVFSALALPELERWTATDASAVHEVRLVIEAVAWDNAHAEFHYALQADGDFVLQLPGLALFRVSAEGDLVTLRLHAQADPQLLRAHFYGSVVAVLCYLRGLLPLHGACVQVGDAAVIFSGVSGAGKSTTAAAFARAGYRVLCDDVCAIALRSARVEVWPAFPRLKLLPDAIKAFALDTSTLYTQAARGEKGHFLQQDSSAATADCLKVAAIYLLDDRAVDQTLLEPLRGAAAFLALKTQVHRSNMGASLGKRDRIFRDLSQMLSRVPVWSLSRPRDLARIEETVRAVAQHRQTGSETPHEEITAGETPLRQI